MWLLILIIILGILWYWYHQNLDNNYGPSNEDNYSPNYDYHNLQPRYHYHHHYHHYKYHNNSRAKARRTLLRNLNKARRHFHYYGKFMKHGQYEYIHEYKQAHNKYYKLLYSYRHYYEHYN